MSISSSRTLCQHLFSDFFQILLPLLCGLLNILSLSPLCKDNFKIKGCSMNNLYHFILLLLILLNFLAYQHSIPLLLINNIQVTAKE